MSRRPPPSTIPRLEVTVRSRRLTADRRVRFGRWLGNPRRAVAALETERRVAWKFVDLTGRPIDVHLVQRLVLRSITGEVTTYTGDQLKQPHWLLAQRVVPLTGGLQAKDPLLQRPGDRRAALERRQRLATAVRADGDAAADVPAVVLSAGAAGRGRAVRPARRQLGEGRVPRRARRAGAARPRRDRARVAAARQLLRDGAGRRVLVPHPGGGVEAAERGVPGRHLPRRRSSPAP